jgi:sigma-E factor negative regulatory protein RseC
VDGKNIISLYAFEDIMMQKVTEVIRHTGVVERISDNNCYVRILQNSACAGCSAAHLCNSSESKEKIVTVLLDGLDVQVGETVNIEGAVAQGLRAVYICYLVPLILMVVSLFVGVRLGGELWGVLLSLVILAVYFSVLFVFKNNIGKHFGFTISKISSNENHLKILPINL